MGSSTADNLVALKAAWTETKSALKRVGWKVLKKAAWKEFARAGRWVS